MPISAFNNIASAPLVTETAEAVPVSTIERLVSSQFVWAILCLIVVYVFWRKMESNSKDLKSQNESREQEIKKLYQEHKEEAAQREAKLINHLERTTDTLQGIEKNLQKLDEKMDKGFKEIWDHVDNTTPQQPWNGVERRR